MKKLFAILLAFIFLATNLPFAITTHFCSGQAVNSAFVLKGNTVDCGMNETNTINHFSSTTNFLDNLETAPCCQNHSQVFEITDDYSSALELSLPTDYSSFQVFFVANFVKTFFDWLFADFDFPFSYLIPAPPLLKKDILILFQCFLI
jgi:hypothetical protein